MALKYHIKTYGCQMNVHESEKLAGILIDNGYQSCEDPRDADVIVLNTCCIRESAETHILGNLGIIKKLKETKPQLKVAVCGCMAQKEGSAQKLKKRCPFIDIIFGTHNLHKFSDYLLACQKGIKVTEVWEKESEITENIPVYRTSGCNAWVNIMYGCNNFCSYCIVPYVRGRERSRAADNIIKDVQNLVRQGYKEITLLGQNVNSYSCDGLDFNGLLNLLSDIEGEYWIKFMTSHPKDISENVIKTIADKKRLAHFVHLPIQAGSNRVLALMNRRYTAEDYLQKIKMIRDYMPDVGLSTDIMVGFPTETEDDFIHTLDVVEKVRYNNLYSFIYSRRSGTPADKMEQVALAVKKDRIARLIDKQFQIANALAKESVGKTYTVLCDGSEDGMWIGKTQSEKKVLFMSDINPTNTFVQVKITEAQNSKLRGIQINI